MKVLVIGVIGFIGGEYVKYLCVVYFEVQVFFGGWDVEWGNQLVVVIGVYFYCGDLIDGIYVSGVCK